MAVAERFKLGESVTLWWTYRTLTDAFTTPPTRALYDPTTPTLVITKPDGTTSTATSPAVTKPASTVGYYEYVLTVDQIGHWHYLPSDPDATKPGHTMSHFHVEANPT